jgi:hypothetical protein
MITRRSFIGLSAAAATLAVTGCQTPSSDAPKTKHVPAYTGSRKKGIGLGSKHPQWAPLLTQLQCKWVYTWNRVIPEGVPPGVEFIPMIWNYNGQPDSISVPATAAKKAGITELMGFNEPDAPKQGNMSVQAALDAWPLLEKTGMRLGSPGCIHPDKQWMIDFMAGVKQRNLRVDFVCAHSYGGPNPDALMKRLENVHKMFGLPIWLTEFGVGDWKAKSVEENVHKPESVLRFMERVLPMLEKSDFVERYAWFPAKPTSIPLGTSALFDANGELTRLGACYRDA